MPCSSRTIAVPIAITSLSPLLLLSLLLLLLKPVSFDCADVSAAAECRALGPRIVVAPSFVPPQSSHRPGAYHDHQGPSSLVLKSIPKLLCLASLTRPAPTIPAVSWGSSHRAWVRLRNHHQLPAGALQIPQCLQTPLCQFSETIPSQALHYSSLLGSAGADDM